MEQQDSNVSVVSHKNDPQQSAVCVGSSSPIKCRRINGH